MKFSIVTIALCLLASTALAGSEMQGATETRTPLLKQPLHGMAGKEVDAVRLDIPPGWQTPRHIHPGNVFVYVLEGSVEIDLAGGQKQTASAGEMLYETPNQAMVGRNASSSEGAKILVFFVGDEGQPLTVPVKQ